MQPTTPEPIRFGGAHCCLCRSSCNHIGPIRDCGRHAQSAAVRQAILDELDRQRADPEFVERLARRIREDRPLLDRLRQLEQNDIVERGARRRRPWWLPPDEPMGAR